MAKLRPVQRTRTLAPARPRRPVPSPPRHATKRVVLELPADLYARALWCYRHDDLGTCVPPGEPYRGLPFEVFLEECIEHCVETRIARVERDYNVRPVASITGQQRVAAGRR